MKKIFSILFAIVFSCAMVVAQTPMDAAKNIGGQAMQSANISAIMSDLTTNIKSCAFTPTFKKSMDDYLTGLKSMNESDMAAAGTSVVQLAGGLKSSSFLNGWTPTMDMMNNLKKSTSMSEIASMAQTLVSNMDPEIFKKGFNPAAVTSALGMLNGMN